MATNPTWRRGCRGGEGIYSQGRSRTVLGPLRLFLNKPKTNSNRSFKTLYNLPRFLLLKKNQTLLFDIEFLKIVLKQAKAFTFFFPQCFAARFEMICIHQSFISTPSNGSSAWRYIWIAACVISRGRGLKPGQSKNGWKCCVTASMWKSPDCSK